MYLCHDSDYIGYHAMLLFMKIAIAHQGHLVAMKIENPVEEVSIANLYKKDISNLQRTHQRG